jgi:hypothetical protein
MVGARGGVGLLALIASSCVLCRSPMDEEEAPKFSLSVLGATDGTDVAGKPGASGASGVVFEL